MTFKDIDSFYSKQWGISVREAVFEKYEIRLRVLKWSSSPATGGVSIYATVDASDFSESDNKSDHEYEFFLGFSPECDDIAGPLAQLRAYARTADVRVGPGHIYRAPGPLLPSGAFDGFLLITPLDLWYEPVQLEGGRHIQLLMAIPLFRDELDFAAGRGGDALLDIMSERNVPFWKPVRRSTFDEAR
jgi:Suppressor of fused protein (SUFU)